MSVHLNEGKATVGLEARLDHVAKVLEERDQVVGGGVGGQVSNVAGCLVGRGLIEDHLVALHAVGREVVVAIGSGRGHTHGLHRLLLSNRGLALLVRPVAADSSGSKPLSIHGAQSLLGIWAVTEGHETISARAASLHVPHDASLRDRAKDGEGLRQHLVVDLVGQITNEDVEVVGCILLGRRVGRLIRPVDADFLFKTQCVSR